MRRYEAMPHLHDAELIEGRVIVSSPIRAEHHGDPHFKVNGLLAMYDFATAGVTGSDNSTTELDPDNLPQPDLSLRIEAGLGGGTRMVDGYIVGPPEFVFEVAGSSASIDLHDKLRVYRRNKVPEYVVWRTYDGEIDAFRLAGSVYAPEPLNADPVFRSRVLPGLWIDTAAMAAWDWPRALATLQAGLQSPEHAAFVQELAGRRTVTP